MASMVPPQYGVAYTFYVALVDQSNTKVFKSNPTIASGDWKVSKSGGALANLTTLPSVEPAGSVMVKIALSATEMEADNVTVVGIDAAGAEWASLVINIQTSARRIDDLATQTSVNTIDDFLDTEIADIQARLPAALVSGRIDASVGAVAANALTASALAADAVTEIQSGLATSASISALNNLSAAQVNAEVDTALADYDAPTKAELDSAVATLATAANLATVAGYLDTEIAAILAAIDTEVATLVTNVAAILADTGTDGVALSSAVQNAIADAILSRGVSNVEDAADTTSLAAIILATLESSMSGTTWTIRKTDGTTFTTKTLTVDDTAEAVTGVT